MLHAGLAPQWDLELARRCAREFENGLRSNPEKLFDRLYGDQPDRWDEVRSGEERLRFIANCFTRLRYVDADGRLMLRAKGSPKKPQSASLDPLVRGAAGSLARAAHRLRPLVDLGVFQQCRCHRPRYGLRLGRRIDRAAIGRPRCETRPSALRVAEDPLVPAPVPWRRHRRLRAAPGFSICGREPRSGCRFAGRARR